jgi:predicted kinase
MKDIAELARGAGLTVILNGRIGHQEYRSVAGSLVSLQRFADAYANEPIAPSGIAERLRNRAALQIDDNDAHLMRAAARAIARLHYQNLAFEAAVAATAESSSPAR